MRYMKTVKEHRKTTNKQILDICIWLCANNMVDRRQKGGKRAVANLSNLMRVYNNISSSNSDSINNDSNIDNTIIISEDNRQTDVYHPPLHFQHC